MMKEFRPTPRHVQKLSIGEVNALSEHDFVDKIGRLFPGGKWIAESAYRHRPFTNMYDLRRALQDAVFAAPQERPGPIHAPGGSVDLVGIGWNSKSLRNNLLRSRRPGTRGIVPRSEFSRS
jgi:hypothetical protein